MNSLRKTKFFTIEEIIDPTPSIRELVLLCHDPTEFNFKAGQFVMLHVPQEGQKPALRAYSIASNDQIKNGFKLIFKYVENGTASRFIWSLKGHENLEFTGPFGKVFFQEPPTEQIIFLNTGSGVSQHLSFLYSKKNSYPHLKYRMLFGLRTEADIYEKSNLDRLTQELSDFKYEYVLSRPSANWIGKKGYVQDFIHEFNYLATPTTFYLCGNGEMIKALKNQLIEKDGMDPSRLWTESFD